MILALLLAALASSPVVPAAEATGFDILHSRIDALQPSRRHAVSGLVVSVDRAASAVVVSHDPIPDVMEAMTMAFEVRDASELDGIDIGDAVTFTLVLDDARSWIEQVRERPYQPDNQDPVAASRLRMLSHALAPERAARAVPVGQVVPDFTLVDQQTRPVRLSELRGRTVVVNFVYTSCALPEFCYRVSNHFGVLKRRFADALGSRLVLLTVTFDPVRDDPAALARYAEQWQASPPGWHFLTGPEPDVQRACDLFGVDAFPEEGLMNHNTRVAIIDADGRLVANLIGNRYTARQLGDLVENVIPPTR